jgi:hypothetical protein
MQKSVRLNENAYMLLRAIAKKEKRSLANMLDVMIERGSRAPQALNPFAGTNRKPERETVELPAYPGLYAVIVEATGQIIRDELEHDAAEELLAEHNADGDLTIVPSKRRR